MSARTKPVTAPPPPFFMRMGCTNEVITYRAAGNEGVCLQSPQHGVQMLANFNPALGDIVGLDDILETTQAHANLSDVAQYITSSTSAAGTTLYIDLTGHGLVGTPFALLGGVTTSVAALVADGGIKYVPDQVAIAPAFNTPITLRPDGLETVLLGKMLTGIGPEQIYGFNAALNDTLELANILNRTQAAVDLSNIGSYVTATTNAGNTILSVDPTGHGQPGTAFAVLEGVSTSVAQLVSNGGLEYDPTNIASEVKPGMTFIYRAAGAQSALLENNKGNVGPAQLQGFSLAEGDGINVKYILAASGVQADLSNIQNFFSTTQVGADTDFWFNAAGSGAGGVLEAVVQNSSITINELLMHSALHLTM